MIAVYCDTSAVLPIFVREPATELAEATLGEHRVVLSDLTVLEFSSAVARLLRERKMDETRARETLREFQEWARRGGEPAQLGQDTWTAARGFVERFDLALRWPDALHLALARQLSLPIVSLDARLIGAARTLGVGALTMDK